MDTPTPPGAHAPPVIVPPDPPEALPAARVAADPLPSAPPSPPSGARRPAMPNPRQLRDEDPVEVPAFEAFSFTAGKPLTPDELQTITLFHEQYMQMAQGDWTRRKLSDAQHDAATVLPLMQRQLDLATQTPEGARGGEARQVQANLDWVEQLLGLEAGEKRSA